MVQRISDWRLGEGEQSVRHGPWFWPIYGRLGLFTQPQLRVLQRKNTSELLESMRPKYVSMRVNSFFTDSLAFVTGNPKKLEEVRDILKQRGLSIPLKSCDLDRNYNSQTSNLTHSG